MGADRSEKNGQRKVPPFLRKVGTVGGEEHEARNRLRGIWGSSPRKFLEFRVDFQATAGICLGSRLSRMNFMFYEDLNSLSQKMILSTILWRDHSK